MLRSYHNSGGPSFHSLIVKGWGIARGSARESSRVSQPRRTAAGRGIACGSRPENSRRRAIPALALCAAALAINVGLNARLIPAWSMDGAAWSTLGTEIFLTAGCGVALWSLRAPAQPRQLVTEA